MDQRAALGRRGEDLAGAHLEQRGYRIIERNVRSRYGEIDLVAMDGECIVFVEVRTRRSRQMTPEESVTVAKQRRIAALGARYLQDHGRTDADWRADVVAIEIDASGAATRIEHIISAVEEQ